MVHVVSDLIEVEVEAVVVVSPAKTPLIMLATGEMIFPRPTIGTTRNIRARWPTLRYLRPLETVAQVPRENRGRRPIDLINSLSNLCQQQVSFVFKINKNNIWKLKSCLVFSFFFRF